MATVHSLKVWNKSRELALAIDPVVTRMQRRKPRQADQIERAAESIMAAIAEGRGRSTDKDFAHYLSIAIGSTTELESHLQRALDLTLIGADEHATLRDATIEVRKMLIGFRKRLVGK